MLSKGLQNMRHIELLETLYSPEKLNDKILDKIFVGLLTFQHSFSSSEIVQDYYHHKIHEMLGFDGQLTPKKTNFDICARKLQKEHL